jgi:hypothetical protein
MTYQEFINKANKNFVLAQYPDGLFELYTTEFKTLFPGRYKIKFNDDYGQLRINIKFRNNTEKIDWLLRYG